MTPNRFTVDPHILDNTDLSKINALRHWQHQISVLLEQLQNATVLFPPTPSASVYLDGTGHWSIPTGSGGGGTGVVTFGEVPSGLINGVNKSYTTANTYQPNKLAVYLNGLRQQRALDYTETSSTAFSFVNAPLSGDTLTVDYQS